MIKTDTTAHKKGNTLTITSLNNFKETGFIADYFQTSTPKKYGIIVLGGSEGGKPNHLANKIAKLGYCVLSLAYFKEGEHLPRELEMISLEYISKAKDWFLQQNDVRSDGIILMGWSKGAELALVLASQNDIYKATIAIAPSSVVWPGLISDWTKQPKSSWSKNNRPLPYVPFAPRIGPPKRISDVYQDSLDKSNIPTNTTIDLKKIKYPVLLLSGGLDTVWPANAMATTILKEINKNIISTKDLCTHYNYPLAGHLLDEKFKLGGTIDDNYKANKDSCNKIEEFLTTINL